MKETYKILIIDDERINRQTISETLQPYYELYLAKDTLQGLAIAKKSRPDLILMDIIMPEESGYEAIIRLKDDPVLADIPVIFLTSMTSSEDEHKGFELGAVDYVTKPFNSTTLKMRVANHLNIVQKQRELEQLTKIDNLTQINNRFSFDAHLENELRRAIRNKSQLTLVMCDIDHFKKFNDHYGHVAGDDALYKVAQCLERNMRRPTDFIARYGGEEFAIIYSDTPAEKVEKSLEKCLSEIHNLRIPHEKSDSFDFVSISMGAYSITPSKDMTADSLILKADDILYKAKEAGRNGFIVE